MSHTLGYGEESGLHRLIREYADAALDSKEDELPALREENRQMKRQRDPQAKRDARNARKQARRKARKLAGLPRDTRNEPPPIG